MRGLSHHPGVAEPANLVFDGDPLIAFVRLTVVAKQSLNRVRDYCQYVLCVFWTGLLYAVELPTAPLSTL